jgi:hypothetical protein
MSRCKFKLYLYGNVLIDSDVKKSAILSTLPKWLEVLNAPGMIRIRGKFALEVKEELRKLSGLTVVTGDDFLEWRKQSYEDVRLIDSKYILLFNEDHIPIMEQAKFAKTFSDIQTFDIDVFQYSWFQQYHQFRLASKSLDGASSNHLISIRLSKESLREILKWDRRWIISLTCIYKKKLLLNVLGSTKPMWRTKDPRSPHDVEQKPESKFFLPLNFGIPNHELGVSLDDDNTISGSSAISRGLFIGERSPRGENHESRNSPIARFERVISLSLVNGIKGKLSPNLKALVFKFFLFPNSLYYSVQVLQIRFKDSKNLKKKNYRSSSSRLDLAEQLERNP